MAIGGKRGQINIIDFNTKTIIKKYPKGSSFSFGHTNRIFKVKFSTDQNLLFSGGWDQTVFLWDIRV